MKALFVKKSILALVLKDLWSLYFTSVEMQSRPEICFIMLTVSSENTLPGRSDTMITAFPSRPCKENLPPKSSPLIRNTEPYENILDMSLSRVDLPLPGTP